MAANRPLDHAERAIVSTLLDSKAVDFEAIGKSLAEHGPSAALTLDGEDVFCGTMRRFIRVFRINDPQVQVQDLGGLRELGGELRG
jgi:hypothetical protein